MCKSSSLFFLAGAILALCLASCQSVTPAPAVDVERETKAVEQAIRSCIGWAQTKDFPLLNRTIANDPDYLEVDPTPGIIRGFAEFKKNELIWGKPEFKAIRYEIRDLKINLSKSGDVAWFYCVLDDVNEWKGRPASWLNTRWTGVLEKRNGAWVVVQMHFSFAQER